MGLRLLAAGLGLGLGLPMASSLAQAADVPSGAIRIHADQLAWTPAPPSLPAGAEVALLEGDPRGPGLFTLRIRVPAGARLMPHTHPRPERVTVLSGALGLGFGTVYDQTRLQVFRAGDYYVNPPGVPHYLGFAQDTVVQITTEGPWSLEYLQPHRSTRDSNRP